MERDFLGLSSKASLVTVKEEACDGSKDSVAALKSSGMQLSFSSEVSAIPQFLSFKASQEDRQREMAHDSVFSSGYMSMSTTDAFNCNQKPYAGMVQKTTVLDKQGGNHSVMKNYAMQHLNANQVQRPQEMRMFPISSKLNQTIVVSMTTPVLHSHLNSTGQSVDGNTINSQPHGGVSIKSPVSVLVPTSSIIGTTDIRLKLSCYWLEMGPL